MRIFRDLDRFFLRVTARSGSCPTRQSPKFWELPGNIWFRALKLALPTFSSSFCLIKKMQKIKATKEMLPEAAVASLNPAKLAFGLLLVLNVKGSDSRRVYGRPRQLSECFSFEALSIQLQYFIAGPDVKNRGRPAAPNLYKKLLRYRAQKSDYCSSFRL